MEENEISAKEMEKSSNLITSFCVSSLVLVELLEHTDLLNMMVPSFFQEKM
jgi:hypothetical protein